MSSFHDTSLRSEFKAIGRAVLMLLALAAGTLFLFSIFFWELQLADPFSETGPIELCQSAILAASCGLFFLEAWRRPELRGSFVLVGGFIGCMLIREQDYFLDFIRHGCWLWPALLLAGLCLAFAASRFRDTVAGLERFVRWKYFPFLLIGLVIVLAYSRLFGMRVLWEVLLGDSFQYAAKTAMEESSELLGYMFVLVSAILANTDRHLR